MTKFFRQLPPLKSLVVFEAAYRLHSFTRAADELALSQASVSRRIRELETDLEVNLFERRRHDVLPTAEAETLAVSVRLSLNEIATTAARLRGSAAGNSLVIYSDMSLAHTLIAPVLGDFQRHNPDIQLRVLASSEPVDSLREHFDIGLQYDRLAEDRFEIEPIASDVIFPVCSPELAARLPASPSAVDIAAQRLLHFEDPNRDWPDWRRFLALFRVKEPRPLKELTFSSYLICLEVAAGGEGIALGWGRTVQARLDDGSLVRIPGLAMPLADSINVYRPRGARRNPAADRFVKLLRSKIEPVS